MRSLRPGARNKRSVAAHVCVCGRMVPRGQSLLFAFPEYRERSRRGPGLREWLKLETNSVRESCVDKCTLVLPRGWGGFRHAEFTHESTQLFTHVFTSPKLTREKHNLYVFLSRFYSRDDSHVFTYQLSHFVTRTTFSLFYFY